MPSWVRGAVFMLCALPLAAAVSGALLNINVGSYVDSYMEILLERQRENTEQSADRIIAAFNTRVDQIEQRLEVIVHDAAEADAALELRLAAIETRLSAAGPSLRNRIRELEAFACQSGYAEFCDVTPTPDPPFGPEILR